MTLTSVLPDSRSIETVRLSNGSTLYHRRLPGAPRVAFEVFIQGGNRVEPVTGLADMVDNLLMEGTTTRSAEDIAIAMDTLALELDIDTRRDYSVMSALFLAEDMAESFELISDLLFHSTFAEFEKEKVRFQGELIMDLDSPRSRSHDLLMTTILADTPYKASHSNILAALDGIDAAGVKAHYSNLYQPANLFFCVVGDVPADQVAKQIESHFTLPQGENYALVQPAKTPKLGQSQYVTAAKDDSSQLHVFKGWFAPELGSPHYASMVVLNTILGGAGLTSRLFLELRDKQGLAYNVRSQFESSRFLGLFSLYIGTDPGNRQKVLNGFEIECQKLMDHPVSAKELAEAKENILGRRVVYMETAHQQCTYIGTQLALGLNLSDLDTAVERIEAVTALQVQDIAQNVMTQPNVISAVGPSKAL